MPFFSELVTHTDETRRAFENNAVVLDAVSNGLPIERYRNLLLELYQIVWHFNPICAAGASRMADEYQGVRYYLYEHLHEESGHEEWVVNDLQAVGVSREAIHSHKPSVWTLGLIGYNRWAADRRNPCSVLGMMYCLEVIASVYGGPFASAIHDSLLLQGSSGISFISSHATLDVNHMAALRCALDLLTDRAAQDSVLESAIINFHYITKVFESI